MAGLIKLIGGLPLAAVLDRPLTGLDLALPQVANGCKWHKDCFTCPFEDCRFGCTVPPEPPSI